VLVGHHEPAGQLLSALQALPNTPTHTALPAATAEPVYPALQPHDQLPAVLVQVLATPVHTPPTVHSLMSLHAGGVDQAPVAWQVMLAAPARTNPVAQL
jgi:hypothetical protein